MRKKRVHNSSALFHFLPPFRPLQSALPLFPVALQIGVNYQPALRAWELILTNERNGLTGPPERLPHNHTQSHCRTDKYEIEELSQSAIGGRAKMNQNGKKRTLNRKRYPDRQTPSKREATKKADKVRNEVQGRKRKKEICLHSPTMTLMGNSGIVFWSTSAKQTDSEKC